MKHILAVSLLALSSGAALAQAEGDLPGTLVCSGVAGVAATRVVLTASFGNGRASYSAPASGPSGGAGARETGGGALGPGRHVVLTGQAKAAGFTYQARYEGEVGGRGGMLTGRQTGTAGGRSFSRPCQLTFGDGRG